MFVYICSVSCFHYLMLRNLVGKWNFLVHIKLFNESLTLNDEFFFKFGLSLFDLCTYLIIFFFLVLLIISLIYRFSHSFFSSLLWFYFSLYFFIVSLYSRLFFFHSIFLSFYSFSFSSFHFCYKFWYQYFVFLNNIYTCATFILLLFFHWIFFL